MSGMATNTGSGGGRGSDTGGVGAAGVVTGITTGIGVIDTGFGVMTGETGKGARGVAGGVTGTALAGGSVAELFGR